MTFCNSSNGGAVCDTMDRCQFTVGVNSDQATSLPPLASDVINLMQSVCQSASQEIVPHPGFQPGLFWVIVVGVSQADI